eukprot:6480916-Amphidinium_carterae.2
MAELKTGKRIFPNIESMKAERLPDDGNELHLRTQKRPSGTKKIETDEIICTHSPSAPLVSSVHAQYSLSTCWPRCQHLLVRIRKKSCAAQRNAQATSLDVTPPRMVGSALRGQPAT